MHRMPRQGEMVVGGGTLGNCLAVKSSINFQRGGSFTPSLDSTDSNSYSTNFRKDETAYSYRMYTI